MKMKQFSLLGINCWVNYIKQIIENKHKNKKTEKKFLEAKKVCRRTFRLPKVAATDAKSVCIVGDFNNWNTHANPMKKLKDGDYRIELDLELGREYQFRYLIDELKSASSG